MTPLLFAALVSVAQAAPHGEAIVTAFAGTGKPGYAGDGGLAAKAELKDPFDVALDEKGNLYFSDTSNHCVRRVDAKTGTITTVAGCGKKGFGGDGGPATEALLNEPYGVAIDPWDNLFIVDRLNARVRVVSGDTGKIETLAGTGEKGFDGDGGRANQAKLREPNGVAYDIRGLLYVADVADHRVRVVNLKAGTIKTFCGTGKKESSGDGGPFGEASLMGPRAVAVSMSGDVYICEREGNCVRKVNVLSGKIERVAGTGKKGYTGDGGPALEATFNGPKEIEVDLKGNVYVVDTENHVVRRIDAKTRVISNVAGSGKLGATGDGGPATRATLGRPHGVAVGRDGALYIGDTLSHKVRRVK